MSSLRSFIIPQHDDYIIDIFGEVRTKDCSHILEPGKNGTVFIDGESIPVKNLLALTFIGPIDLPVVVYGPLESRNVTYDFRHIEHDDAGNVIIDGNMLKAIPGFQEYAISSKGVVWSKKRNQFMHCTYNENNYVTITLADATGYRTPYKVHQLVYMAWIGPLDYSLVIDHNDGKKWNNDYRNLEQVTQSENVRRAHAYGRGAKRNRSPIIKSESDVHKVCELIASIKSPSALKAAIAEYLGVPADQKVTHLIHRLKTGKAFKDIAAQYEIYAYDGFAEYDELDSQTIDLIVNEIKTRHTPAKQLMYKYSCTFSAIETVIRMYIN